MAKRGKRFLENPELAAPPVKCPFCQLLIIGQEERVAGHFQSVHAHLGISLLNAKYRNIFPKSSFRFSTQSAASGATQAKNRSRSQGLAIEVDESGLIRRVKKIGRPLDGTPDRRKPLPTELCPICSQSVTNLSGHLTEVHHLVLLRDGALKCIQCLGLMKPEEAKKHICKPVSPPAQAETSTPTTTFQDILRQSIFKPPTRKKTKPTGKGRQKKKGKGPTEQSKEQSIFEHHQQGQDGGRYLGWMAREQGRFGSLPEYDDHSDEGDAG